MIVVFGSMNVDLLFTVDRLPGPGETLLCPSYSAQCGGKGMNQAVAAARAGAEVSMFGCVGNDGFGDTVLGVLAAEGIKASGVARVNRPTGCASIWIDTQARNSIVVASGANQMPSADAVPDALLGPGTTLVLQMEVGVEQNWRLLPRARARGARTILNVAPFAPVPAAALALCDVIVLNEVEATQLAGTEAAFDTVARDIAHRSGGTCVITLGPDGSLAAKGEQLIATQTLAIDAVDSTGAGDAFTGVLAAALDAGRDLPTALRWANAGGALACTAVGAQASLPRVKEIEASVERLRT
jgi:ribokinase